MGAPPHVAKPAYLYNGPAVASGGQLAESPCLGSPPVITAPDRADTVAASSWGSPGGGAQWAPLSRPLGRRRAAQHPACAAALLALLGWATLWSRQYRPALATQLAGSLAQQLAARPAAWRPGAARARVQLRDQPRQLARAAWRQLRTGGHSGEGYVAICAAVKDQHLDVREWVAYHHMIGVERFYIVDPGSTPPLSTVLGDHIASGLVNYTWQARRVGRCRSEARTRRCRCCWEARRPLAALGTLAQRSRSARGRLMSHEWMAFVDADEFLVLRDGSASLPALLADYEGAGGLVVNWQMFGSSGHEARPAANTLLAYTQCLPPRHPDNAHVKSIVRPARTRQSGGTPHAFAYHPPWHAVNTRGQRVYTVRSDEAGAGVALERLALHHYVTKSLYDYWLKRARGTGMGNSKDMYFFDLINSQANHTCLEAAAAGARLARLLERERRAGPSPAPAAAAAVAEVAAVATA
eukprot:scaffold10.g2406.t1